MIDYYAVLGIKNHSASKKTINEKYKSLIGELNKGVSKDEGNSKKYKTKLAIIEESYKVLSDSSKRKIYDQALILSKNNEELLKGKESIPQESELPIIEKNVYVKEDITKFSPKEEGEIGSIIFILLLIGFMIYIFVFSSNKLKKPQPIIINTPTRISVVNTPTLSTHDEKQSALNVALCFANLLEKEDEHAIDLLDPESPYYDTNNQKLRTMIHDSLKYGEKIRIYDLEISYFSDTNATVSGIMEKRPFEGWKKYYIEIFLFKTNEQWQITDWDEEKT